MSTARGGTIELDAQTALATTPATAKRLAKLGLTKRRDLLLHLPLRYEDYSHISKLTEAQINQAALFELDITDSQIIQRSRRQLLVDARDDSGFVKLRFLHFYPSQLKQFQPGSRLRLFGEPRYGITGLELVHPKIIHSTGTDKALTPIYPTTAGLSQEALRKLVLYTLDETRIDDPLPASILRRYRLMPLAEAIELLHRPPANIDQDALIERDHPAWQRIKFDELLAQQLSLRMAYAKRRRQPAFAIADTVQDSCGKLLASLDFALTGAQQKVWAEIYQDLQASYPMQRLLQGDVGSGKTIIAALAMAACADAGFQAALMAPTEILAEQHFQRLSAWLKPLGLPPVLISGSLSRAKRRPALAALASCETALVVGTHALVEQEVEFANLALAIVDEQHRFGVRHRLSLRSKAGNKLPHMLMMSATPIPRTLAMSYYADLDVSVIDELPPGRRPVTTKLISDERRDEIIQRVHQVCLSGRQAYWVCPLIEESEHLQLVTAEQTYALLQQELPDLNIGLLHGRLKSEEKNQLMSAFGAGQIHLLVATTVIEVGVDVANASTMVIEHAERFGLAQLHQLRGRVGRGEHESICILMYGRQLSQTSKERLKVIYQQQDGFRIAHEDLRIRGPGEFIGARQSGAALLRFADLSHDDDLLEQSRTLAEELISADSPVVDAVLRHWLADRHDLLKA